MPSRIRSLFAVTAFAAAAAVTATAADAQKKYDPGASDTEIKIGNIMPYSGPASAYGVIGKTQAAATQDLAEQHLFPVTKNVASDKPVGIVTDQSPKPGSDVKKNSQVTISVSQGLEVVARVGRKRDHRLGSRHP